MAILDALRNEKLGVWKTNDELFAALRVRDSAALSALASVLGLDTADQKELAQGEGADVLCSVVADLRQQKGARVAAARCCMEAGLPQDKLAALFLCAADLITDPRLGGKARVLAETGMQAAIAKREDLRTVTMAAGDFARGASAAASVLGAARVKEILATAPSGHSGAMAASFGLGEELPGGARESWGKLLVEQCTANRKAPAAAKRMGLAPPWPPYLPEAFAPLIKAAEEKTAGVATTDALARAGKTPPAKAGVVQAAPAAAAPTAAASASTPAASVPASSPSSPGAHSLQSVSARPASAEPLPPLGKRSSSQYLGTKKMEAPIQGQRRPTGQLVEKPDVRESRTMPEVVGRPQEGMLPDHSPQALAARAAKAGVDPETLAKTEILAGRLPPSVLAALAADRGIFLPDGRFYKGDEPLRFDPAGKRIPRVDRWEEYTFEWQDPVLPASKLRPPGSVQQVPGPFAARLKSIYADRPEAVERLCAAAEARAALVGDERLFTELTLEMASARWRRSKLPAGQIARLRLIAADEARPLSWRKSAEALLAMDSRPRSPEESKGMPDS